MNDMNVLPGRYLALNSIDTLTIELPLSIETSLLFSVVTHRGGIFFSTLLRCSAALLDMAWVHEEIV